MQKLFQSRWLKIERNANTCGSKSFHQRVHEYFQQCIAVQNEDNEEICPKQEGIYILIDNQRNGIFNPPLSSIQLKWGEDPKKSGFSLVAKKSSTQYAGQDLFCSYWQRWRKCVAASSCCWYSSSMPWRRRRWRSCRLSCHILFLPIIMVDFLVASCLFHNALFSIIMVIMVDPLVSSRIVGTRRGPSRSQVWRHISCIGEPIEQCKSTN